VGVARGGLDFGYAFIGHGECSFAVTT
jgi:hypothetical protein